MIVILLAYMLAAGAPTGAASERPELQCNTGPATKQFGSTSWLVYACDDDRSVVVVAAPPSPASPFVFVVTPNGTGGIELHGEGTGERSATQQAYDSLSSMSSTELSVLWQQAKQAGGN